jgi:hypothetical protein
VDLKAFSSALITIKVRRAGQSISLENYKFKKSLDFIFIYRVYKIYYGKDIYIKLYNNKKTFRTKDNKDRNKLSKDKNNEKLKKIIIKDIKALDYFNNKVLY